MDDVLNDALSNLEHDNYEISYKGYENRQADIALIRAALTAQPAALDWSAINAIIARHFGDDAENACCAQAAIYEVLVLSQPAARAEPSDCDNLAHELDGVIVDVEQGDGFDKVCLETLKRVRAALLSRYGRPAGDAEYPQAAEVCAELYQVIGSLASDLGVFDHPKVVKALDNAADHALVHGDVLPFPSFERQPAGDALPVRWLVTGQCGHDEYTRDAGEAHRIKEQRDKSYCGEDETRVVPLYGEPVAAQKADDARDAERYRWLRNHFRFAADSDCEIWFDRSLENSPANQLDAAIDAAIAQQRGAEPCFCDRMYPDSNPDATCGDCPRDYRPAARAEPSDAERNAARYLWLRERISVWRTNDGKGPVSWFPVTKIPASSRIQDETDAAIDQSIAEQQKGATHGR